MFRNLKPPGSPRALRWVQGIAGIVAFLILAEVIGLFIPTSVLPRASSVLWQVVRLAGNTGFLGDMGATLEAWVFAMLITVLIGVPVGLFLGSVPGVRYATRAVIEFLRPVPSVALVLLVTLLLGENLRMSVTLMVYGAIWPVLYNCLAGLDDVDPVARETMRAFGFGRLAVIRYVSLPSSAPFIATGIRIASSVAIILNISAGYLTGSLGGSNIGAYIADLSNGPGNIPTILAATVWAGILGVVLNALLLLAERRLIPWHRARFGVGQESAAASTAVTDSAVADTAVTASAA
ncbi:MAG TPA: ABC transporter permease subunit [Trebonia sp.]|nr:ABC transporter permease subunit [Trebonia sp.]